MLTESSLRELLAAGHRITDADFVEHAVENMPRTVYLMSYFLANPRHPWRNSRELQDRINDYLRDNGVTTTPPLFNPVDWFSAKWTDSKNQHPSQHFRDEYCELFERDDTSPISYRINSDLFGSVAKILSELGPPELMGYECELDREGAFNPRDFADARRWDLRAIVIRQGQSRFRADLLNAYGGCCAITGCDAAPALEAAHITPYAGLDTNHVNNGILLRADLHTLFDLDLIGIEPKGCLVHASSWLRGTVYGELDGTPLRLPNAPSARPSYDALECRWKGFVQGTEETNRGAEIL